MTKLKEVFKNLPYKKGDVGLEFEVESNQPLPEVTTQVWDTHEDPSLRNAYHYEYVTKNPVAYDKVNNSINYILKKVTAEGYDPIKDSKTTSWHVHFNALNHTATQVVTSTLLYWLLEPVIISMCGDHRRSNPFCNQLYSSKGMIKLYDEDFFIRLASKNPQDILHLEKMGEYHRYAAQNICAFAKFGSIEYRAMEGTLDGDRVIKWVDTLKAIWSSDFKDPTDVLNYYYDHGLDKLFYFVLHDEVDETLFVSGVEDMVEENALLISKVLSDVPYTWDQLEERIARNLARPMAPAIKNNYGRAQVNINNWEPQPAMIVMDEIAPVAAHEERLFINRAPQMQWNGAQWVLQ